LSKRKGKEKREDGRGGEREGRKKNARGSSVVNTCLACMRTKV
jgi:hypothetical protein